MFFLDFSVFKLFIRKMYIMAKNTIRINEQQLKKIIAESVKKVLKEHVGPEGGYAEYAENDINYQSAYEQATDALYKAAKEGKPIKSVISLIDYQGWQPNSFSQEDWEILYDANEDAFAEFFNKK
jgi:hypothetical protein